MKSTTNVDNNWTSRLNFVFHTPEFSASRSMSRIVRHFQVTSDQRILFDKRPHRCLVTPRGGECIRPTLISSNEWLGALESAPKRHLDRFNRFCVQCSKVSICFSMGPKTPKLPLPLKDLDFHLIRNSLGPPESAPRTISRSVLSFFHSSPTCPTHGHTQTHRLRYV